MRVIVLRNAQLTEPNIVLLNITSSSAVGLPHCIFVPNLRTTQAVAQEPWLPHVSYIMWYHGDIIHIIYETSLSYIYYTTYILVKKNVLKKIGIMTIKSMKIGKIMLKACIMRTYEIYL